MARPTVAGSNRSRGRLRALAASGFVLVASATGVAPVHAQVDGTPTGADLEAVSARHDPGTHTGPPQSAVTWTFRNNTPDRQVTDLRVTVALPPGVRAHGSQLSGNGVGVGCGALPDDRNPSCALPYPALVTDVEMTLFVEYGTAGTFPLTATVSQSSQELSPGDETLTHTVEVEAATADLRLSATPSSTEVAVGDTWSYVVSVANDGPHAATDVVLRDQLPAGLELVSALRGWVGWRCPSDPDSYACPLGTTAPGTSRFVVVTVRAVRPGVATSRPTVSALQSDPDTTSNSAAVSIEVVEPASK
jgi:uncharacterized repeat protein (TIGR01451 family)